MIQNLMNCTSINSRSLVSLLAPSHGTRSIYPRTGYELWRIRIRRGPLSISRHRRVANVFRFPRIPEGLAITIARWMFPVASWDVRTVVSSVKSQTCGVQCDAMFSTLLIKLISIQHFSSVSLLFFKILRRSLVQTKTKS